MVKVSLSPLLCGEVGGHWLQMFRMYLEGDRRKMTQALLVLDVENEFSPSGKKPLPNYSAALAAIERHVDRARREQRPIAWVRMPGADLSPGLGPKTGFGPEGLFEKDVYGAFAGTGIEEWLRGYGVQSVLIVGFYAHICLSTSAREALIRGFEVFIDPEATGARDLNDRMLGRQTADEVRRSALLHLANMGVILLHSIS
jgi:nicotinamidase-related amidase